MDTNLKAVAAGMIEAITQYSPKKGQAPLDIDSSDTTAEVSEAGDGTQTASFTMETMKYSGKQPGRFSPGGMPTGRIVYHVAVVARWEPFEDE